MYNEKWKRPFTAVNVQTVWFAHFFFLWRFYGKEEQNGNYAHAEAGDQYVLTADCFAACTIPLQHRGQYFVAKMSEEALTATSLAFPVQMLMIAFSVGTSVGVNALLSKTLGARNRERATKIANTSIMLALIGGAVFSLTGIFFAQKLARSFTTVESTAALCADYLSICMIFCFGNFIETMLQRFVQAAGNTV